MNAKNNVWHPEAAAKALFPALALAACLAACSTTVRQEVELPANLAVESAGAVSALPFRTQAQMGRASSSDDSPVYSFEEYTRRQGEISLSQGEEKDLLSSLDERLSRRLMAADNITYVDPGDVEYALSRRAAQVPADLYVTGGITEFSSTIRQESEDTGRKDKEGNAILETKYWREASLALLYQVVDARTDRVVSRETYRCSGTSSRQADWKKVESTATLLSSKLDAFVSRIMEDFTPHTERRSLTLLKSRDKEMKEAEKLAGKGMLVPARNKFLSIYQDGQLFEAGYNAALLYEAMEMYGEALSLMTDVWRTSGNSRAKEKIQELQKEKEDAARLQLQKSQRGRP